MILMANPVFDAVRSVMAIREYQDKPIPPDVVTRIVDAGRLTASASNGQEWHFVVVREPETLRALGSLVRDRSLHREVGPRDRRRLREDQPHGHLRLQSSDSVDVTDGMGGRRRLQLDGIRRP